MTRTSRQNGRLAVQLEDAARCLADLAARGANVKGVHVGLHPRPLINVDRPPRDLHGGTVRIRANSRTYAALHMGCQVEWRTPR